MKYDCDVILDLLPLYTRKKLSKRSIQVVEEHLSECPSCRVQYANGMYDDNFDKEFDADSIRYTRRKKNHVFLRLFILLLFAGLICAGLAFLSYANYGTYNFIETAQNLIKNTFGS